MIFLFPEQGELQLEVEDVPEVLQMFSSPVGRGDFVFVAGECAGM